MKNRKMTPINNNIKIHIYIDRDDLIVLLHKLTPQNDDFLYHLIKIGWWIRQNSNWNSDVLNHLPSDDLVLLYDRLKSIKSDDVYDEITGFCIR